MGSDLRIGASLLGEGTSHYVVSKKKNEQLLNIKLQEKKGA